MNESIQGGKHMIRKALRHSLHRTYLDTGINFFAFVKFCSVYHSIAITGPSRIFKAYLSEILQKPAEEFETNKKKT